MCITATRPIYERARTAFTYGAQLADPRRNPEYWREWHSFEVLHGNEETFWEMFRVKRGVQAAFSTVNDNAAEIGRRLSKYLFFYTFYHVHAGIFHQFYHAWHELISNISLIVLEKFLQRGSPLNSVCCWCLSQPKYALHLISADNVMSVFRLVPPINAHFYTRIVVTDGGGCW